MLVCDHDQRVRLVKKIRNRMQRWWEARGPEKGPISHYCLFWAAHTVVVLGEVGLPAQIQAGSTFWRNQHPDLDDGVSPNQWGYKFEWDVKSLSELMNQMLPECHVWVAITPNSGEHELVDLTTCYFKGRCLEDGYPWTNDDPPDFLWASESNFPHEQCQYHPDMKAIQMCYSLLKGTKHNIPFHLYV